jgi:CRISPR/Cas system-associated exonuclease Cas4 (RecB family)
VPELLSPSSVNTFAHDCQVKWFYRKVMQYPESRGAALGLGSAVHAGLAENFRQKIETREDLATEGVIALFRDAWARELDTIALDKADDAGELGACGEVMTRVYMDQAAPRIQPAKVESYVEGLVGDVPVHGYADVIDVDGRVIDIKTAAKKPSGISAGHLVQIATYAILDPAASGEARIDTLTKTRTVMLDQTSVCIGIDEKVQAARLYSIARDAMASGLYMPNRQSNLCSRKYCSYADRCEADYGGRVR